MCTTGDLWNIYRALKNRGSVILPPGSLPLYVVFAWTAYNQWSSGKWTICRKARLLYAHLLTECLRGAEQARDFFTLLPLQDVCRAIPALPPLSRSLSCDQDQSTGAQQPR